MTTDSGTALWTKSCFSFLEGASQPEALVQEAHRLGLRSLALTDRDGVYGAVRAQLEAERLGLKLIHGAQLTVAHREGAAPAPEGAGEGTTRCNRNPNPSKIIGENRWWVVLLVQDARGWSRLCRLITHGRLRSEKGESLVFLDELAEETGGLFALWPGRRSFPKGEAEPEGGLLPAADEARLEAEEAEALLGLRAAFGERLHLLLTRHQHPDDALREARLRRLARRLELSLAAGSEVLYHAPSRRPLHDVLGCIRHGVRLSEAGRLLQPNAEHGLCSPEAQAALFADDPGALAVSEAIAAACDFSLRSLRYRYPEEKLPSGLTSSQWLRQLTFEGARWRYEGRVPEPVRAQLEKELALIEELDYPGYFLTMWEIVEFCRAKGILCQGRGSAANSAVCYCLGITAVDPVRMDLLFERFLSRERPEPPDIDLDIAHERREEVIQWVYETYGRSHAAMVAVVISYRTRSAIREVGKVLGLPEASLDRLAKLAHRHDGAWGEMLEHAGLDPDAPAVIHLRDRVEEIRGMPRHLSIHPGGFLLGQAPVHTLVPIENGSMEERTVIQWDKDDLDALGLFKVDLLGLGSLAVVDRCFELMRRQEEVEMSLATVPAEDPETYDLCCRGDTVGVFQIESRAQMAMLPRLRPRTFYDLVIEVSIVRPGPIAGDMVHPYLARRSGKEPVGYPHACLEPVLRRTLGVPLFQEQVMKLAVVAADYTPGEADQLRRDMAAWKRGGRIEGHHDRLVSRMMAKGIAREFAERVFEQIKGFGEYGFPESHAASFALIGYATAYLKCHHPAAFVCALLNAQPMGFYSPATLVEDARRHGVEIRPVDVTCSDWDCTLERIDSPGAAEADPVSRQPSAVSREEARISPDRPMGGAALEALSNEVRHPGDARLAVRMGLRYVKGLREDAGQWLALRRRLAGIARLEEVVLPGGPDEGGLTRLAEAGAFESLGLSRREALWEVRRLSRECEQSLPLESREAPVRFAGLGALETIAWDHASSRHSTRGHPLEPLRRVLRARGLPDAAGLASLRDGQRARYAGLVITRQRPGTAGGVVFMTLEDESGFVNVVVWEQVYERFALLIKTEAFLEIEGRIQSQEGVVHLIAEDFRIPDLEAPPRPESHDFH
ncbi:MAG: error-prone DNA polymerase [Deltaproteobacteria bacterium]|nr:error-prone DNA polymerase [Deltaproteobacteria bacterium]